ncbi:MAG: hypothetical protein WA159_16060 [Variovorax sp.]
MSGAQDANVAQGVSAAVRGSSTRLLKAAALFATGVATTAALMSAGGTPHAKIGDVLHEMQGRAETPRESQAITGISQAKASERSVVPSALDRERLAVLSRPVPADTRAAAEMARALPSPRDVVMAPLSAEQTKVLAYGQFAPVVAKVFSNSTRKVETHWTLHPWDVARLADQASAEFFKEHRIRVEPRLIAASYYTESSGVVQVGFDQRGVDLINRGKSVDEVVGSGAKASFGLFQIDQGHSDSGDLDPLRGAKRAAGFLAEGQENLKRHPQLGMVAISATYNASSRLRTKIFDGVPLDDAESDAYARVRNHAASMSYGAAIYDIARKTYQAHLAEALKEGLPIAAAAGTVQRPDPLQDERLGAIQALTGRSEISAAAGVPQAPTVAAPAPVPAAVPAVAAAIAEPVHTEQPATPAPIPTVTKTTMPLVTTAAIKTPPPTAAPVTTASTPQRRQVARTGSSIAAVGAGARPNVVTADLDAAIRGYARVRRPTYDSAGAARAVRVEPGVVVTPVDRLPNVGRLQAGFQASVEGWKGSATSVLGRVAAFHEQRTREMAVQQRDLP